MTERTDSPATENACQNTDREIYRERPGDFYADSIHVTEGGGIGINCGGMVYVKPLREWHRLALSAETTTTNQCDGCRAGFTLDGDMHRWPDGMPYMICSRKRYITPSETEAHRPCTCHPADNPPRPCPQKFAYSECVKAARSTVEGKPSRLAAIISEARGSEDYKKEAAELDAAIAKAVAHYEALSPVDKALADSDQRRSYVEGETGRDPGDVLADEVRRLRSLSSSTGGSEREVLIEECAKAVESYAWVEDYNVQSPEDHQAALAKTVRALKKGTHVPLGKPVPVTEEFAEFIDRLSDLAHSPDFWSDKPYGNRLYYGQGAGDYIAADILQAFLHALKAAPSAKGGKSE